MKEISKSLKLKKLNTSAFKKLNDLKLEKERLLVKLEESTRRVNELKVEKELLEIWLRFL